MNAQRLVLTVLVSTLIGLSGSNQALADDSDIYTEPPAFSSDSSPKVLLIFDTSGSMGWDVDSRDLYDPNEDYTNVADYPNRPAAIDKDRVYWARWNTTDKKYDPPAANTDQYFKKTALKCQAAIDALYGADTNGYYNNFSDYKLIVQHETTDDRLWRRIEDINADSDNIDHIVDCYADGNPNTEQQTDSSNYLNKNADNDGYTNASANKLVWSSFNTNDDNKPRLYSGNWLAYWINTTDTIKTRARMEVAKSAITAVIDDNTEIQFGLMIFNYNNDTPHGGRVVQAVGDPNDTITYLDTTINSNANNNDTVIELADTSRFAVGDEIGIELNNGSTQWTTIASNVRTTVTNKSGNQDFTLADASGFSVGDAIGIKDNNDFLNWRTIDTISGNDININSDISESVYADHKVYSRTVTLTDALTGAANSGSEVYGRSTRRHRLKDVIDSLVAEGYTPLSESLYEAYRYFAGKTVVYGGQTTASNRNPISDPCAEDPNNCGIGDSPSRGTYTTPLEFECEKSYIIMMTDGSPSKDVAEQTYLTTSNFPAKPAADGRVIDFDYLDRLGNTVTMSTSINGSGLVPLARWMNQNDINDTMPQSQTNVFYAVGFGSSLDADDKAYLDEATREGTGDPNQDAILASDVNDLKTAFNTFIGNIQVESASFGAPTLSVNAFNKLYNRDEIYFALFEPGTTYKWNGNLKKFRLCNMDDVDDGSIDCNYGEIIDENNNTAIDLTGGRIKTSAQSIWSGSADGGTVTKGGAGGDTKAMDPDADRRMFVWRGTYSSATYPETLVQVDDATGNTLFDAVDGDPTILGLPAAAVTADVTDLIGWMMGKDTYDEDGDSTTTKRWAIADPLHGRPVAITYGAQKVGTTWDYDQPIVKLVMTGNDGAIRMFNDSTGEEEWAFIPQEMLQYQATLKEGTGGHIYGVDSTVTIWVQDNNGNGIIEDTDSDGNNDKVYMYATMRRGPNNNGFSNIYAFDITPGSTLTDKDSNAGITPTLLWVIEGGTGKYNLLGQTWSAPQVERIRIKCTGSSCSGSEEKWVLIFGGGYDTAVENTTSPAVENKVVTKNNAITYGNAIYIADADTGDRLWWASSSTAVDGQGTPAVADLQLTDMKFPIPSDLSLLDSNGDNAIDRLYVGDVGGQLWRIDLDPEIKPTGSTQLQRNGTSSGYVFVDLVCDRATTSPYARSCAGTDDPQEWRRIFYAPDVAGVTDNVYVSTSESERVYDMVFISTGDRPDPLDRLTSRGLSTAEQPVHNAVYGLKDPNFAYGTVASPPRPITPHGATSDVHDATANLIETGTTGSGGTQEGAFNELRDGKGWMVYFKETGIPSWTTTDTIGVAEGVGREWIGEKSLARTVIFGGVVYVTTYTPANPATTTSTCEPNEGLGRVYGLNYLDAKIAIDLDGDGTKERSLDLGGGIPSELVTIIREDGTTGLVGSSGGAVQVEVEDIGGQERTFWRQE